MIKVEDVSEPLTETPSRVAEAVLLFCQVTKMCLNRLLTSSHFAGNWSAFLCSKETFQTKQFFQ